MQFYSLTRPLVILLCCTLFACQQSEATEQLLPIAIAPSTVIPPTATPPSRVQQAPNRQVPTEIARLDLQAEPNKIVINEQSGDMYIQLNHRFVGRFRDNQFVEYLYPTIPPDIEDWEKGNSARDIAMHEAENRLYIMSGFLGQVTVYHNNELENTIKLDGGYAERIAANQNTGEVFVVSSRDDGFQKQLVSILKDGQLLLSFELDDGFNFRDMVVDSVSGYVYLIGGGLAGGIVSVVRDSAEVDRYIFPEMPEDIAIDTVAGNVYTVHRYSEEGEVRLRYFNQGVLEDELTYSEVGLDTRYESVSFSPFNNFIYVYGQGLDGGLHVFQLDDSDKLVYVNATNEPYGPFNYSASDPINANYYMVHTSLGIVRVTNGFEHLGEIEVGFQPSHVSVNEQTHQVYISNEVEGTLSILGFGSDAFLPVISASE